jgi:hypothetical protein
MSVMDIVIFILFRKQKRVFTNLQENLDIKENIASQTDTLELKCQNIYIQVKLQMELEIEDDILIVNIYLFLIII